MKINFKTMVVLTFLSSIMLLVGCQKEEYLQSPTEEKSINPPIGVTETFLTLKDLDQLPEAKAIIKGIIEQKKVDPTQKSIYNPEYDFFIDTDRILRIDNGNYHSLTFPIYRLIDNPDIIENLVLSLQDNGKYLASIYTYKVTPQEKTAILNNQPTNIQGFVSRKILQNFNPDDINARLVQVWYTQIVIVSCSDDVHDSKNFGIWHECTAASKPQVLAITRSIIINTGDDIIPIGSEIGSDAGGGYGGDGSGYTPPAFDPGKDFELVQGGVTRPIGNIKTNEQSFYYDFLGDKGRSMMQFEEYRVPILVYLFDNLFSDESKAHAKQLLDYIHDGHGDVTFLNKAIEFLNKNPEVTPEQFYKIFLTVYDGPIETPINPDNITFEEAIVPTALPSFQSFLAAYPKNGFPGAYNQMPANEVYELVGGTLKASYLSGLFTNACTVRSSRGLLYSNPSIHIPVLTYLGQQRTQKGKDGKNYILDAISFNKFMIARFGDTPHKLEGNDANDINKVYNLLKGKNGIYVIVNESIGKAKYNGHADFLIDGIPIGSTLTNPTGGVKSIRIWVLN